MRLRLGLLILAIFFQWASDAFASRSDNGDEETRPQKPNAFPAEGDRGSGHEGEDEKDLDALLLEAEDAPVYETVVSGAKPPTPELPDHRAQSSIYREQLEMRLPRSAPDALRFEPGVFVQQTAHGQGSAFIRGLTGQQTLLLFDGIRLNNGVYRQGPNQYFFTLDAKTLHKIEVVRGGASTQFGSDAFGGVILALPVEPHFRPLGSDLPVLVEPHLSITKATADDQIGGRTEANIALGDWAAIYGGIGARHVGLLESGGYVFNPQNGELPLVPRFADDGRTQLGTGFDELTGDMRVVLKLAPGHLLKLASYSYRQYDSPRTDHCPPAYAPPDECLKYDEQFRTLVYAAWEGEVGQSLLNSARTTLSWQWQHERRTQSRPTSNVENIWRDDVHTMGISFAAKTKRLPVATWLSLDFNYGTEVYHDVIDSKYWITFTDIDITQQRSRGQYLDGSSYTYGGLFLEGEAHILDWLNVRSGARFSWINSRSPRDPDSGSEALDQDWFPWVGNLGLEFSPLSWLNVLVNFDRSYRAPNIDDLTSRQQTGPGFQIENPGLKPEYADTYEIGLRLVGPIAAEIWGFWTNINGAVVKVPRDASDCPPDSIQCRTSWSRLQLINANGLSFVRGIEASLRWELPRGFYASSTLSWTYGQGPNVFKEVSPAEPDQPSRVPISRIPPLNGTMELLWKHPVGLSAGAALRWATAQKRLALADVSDQRIPLGGTPGFAVLDLRLSHRFENKVLVSLVFENVFDAAYRYHGSAINGPGRGLIVMLDLGPMWMM